jgi:hypothetical protein
MPGVPDAFEVFESSSWSIRLLRSVVEGALVEDEELDWVEDEEESSSP